MSGGVPPQHEISLAHPWPSHGVVMCYSTLQPHGMAMHVLTISRSGEGGGRNVLIVPTHISTFRIIPPPYPILAHMVIHRPLGKRFRKKNLRRSAVSAIEITSTATSTKRCQRCCKRPHLVSIADSERGWSISPLRVRNDRDAAKGLTWCR